MYNICNYYGHHIQMSFCTILFIIVDGVRRDSLFCEYLTRAQFSKQINHNRQQKRVWFNVCKLQIIQETTAPFNDDYKRCAVPMKLKWKATFKCCTLEHTYACMQRSKGQCQTVQSVFKGIDFNVRQEQRAAYALHKIACVKLNNCWCASRCCCCRNTAKYSVSCCSKFWQSTSSGGLSAL